MKTDTETDTDIDTIRRAWFKDQRRVISAVIRLMNPGGELDAAVQALYATERLVADAIGEDAMIPCDITLAAGSTLVHSLCDTLDRVSEATEKRRAGGNQQQTEGTKE